MQTLTQGRKGGSVRQIKYRYCIDENDNLVCIDDVTDATRHAHRWCCLECGQEMVPNLGIKKAWYFSHKVNTACNGESYLHKLAKRRIREKFLSAKSFPITFVRDVPCNQQQECLFFDAFICQEKDVSISFDLKKWKGLPLYDDCQEEIIVEEFRPDLLLVSSTKPNREKIFIEIYKAHKSEEKKVNSKYRIIETMQIKSEDDIEDIIKKGFVEGQNCQTFNFNSKLLPNIEKKDVPIARFLLINGSAHFYNSNNKKVLCEKRGEKIDPNSDCELNINESIIISEKEKTFNNILKPFELCLLYLVKKDWPIKNNCILCKNRENCYARYIGIGYKNYKSIFQCPPRQEMAQNCPYYDQIDPEKMNYPLSELEKNISEVPT